MAHLAKRISVTTKFNPEDERIFCPNVSKDGVTGHGLLKKYYIPHLGVNICEYCEIEEDGERRNLSYYQAKKLSKHLISELQNWREEILKFQNINNDVNVNTLVSSVRDNNKQLDTSERGLDRCREEIHHFKNLVEDKLLTYFSFLEEILLIKDLIDECKFDAKGKLNLIGIGTDSTREAKYIWMSLLFSNMKRQNLNPESFGLTEEIQRSIKNFVDLYINVNSDCTGFVRNLCFNLLPEIAMLENKQITIDCEEQVRRLPSSNTGVDVIIVNQLKARILELESLNNQKDLVISELQGTNTKLGQRLNGSLEEINGLNIKIEELLRLKAIKDTEIKNFSVVITQINEENNRMKQRIIELESLITRERNERDLLSSENSKIGQKHNGTLEEINVLNIKIEELIRLNLQKDSESKNLSLVITQLNEEINRYKNRIIDLENQLRMERENKSSENYIALEKLRGELREVKISHENLFLAKKELETLLLAERERFKGYQESLNELQARNAELVKTRENLTLELHGERGKLINMIALERESERLRNYLAQRETQFNEFNNKFQQMINDYDYLKQSNESLKTQLDGHLTNYNLLTGINQGLAKRQVYMGESNIVSTPLKSLPNIDFSNNNNFSVTSIKLDNLNKSVYEKNDVVSSDAFTKREIENPRSIYESQIYVLNDSKVRPYVNSKTYYTPNNINNITTRNSTINSLNNFNSRTPNIDTNTSLSYTNKYQTEKYPKEIDFFNVNPLNLILSYSSLHRIGEWINSQNTTNNKTYKLNLLYKASSEGFSAEKFKANCVGYTDIVVVAILNTGRIIGGYTPLKWNSGNSEELDSSNRTFIFNLVEGIMLPLNAGAVAITNREKCGPVFGKNDIAISDNCQSVNLTANAGFGTSFNFNGVTAEKFFGASNYYINEYEVYQIYPASI